MKCQFSQPTKKPQLDSALATDFYAKLGTADLLVISFAEHNGAYSTAFFKNILTGLKFMLKHSRKNKPSY
jgi:NAD(P)H-dependent FMN reductase